MVSFFKDRSAANIVWVILLSLSVHAHFFIDPPEVVIGVKDGLISVGFSRFLAGLNPVILIFLYHLLVISQALRLNYLFNDQRMFVRSNFLTAMAYVLVTAVFKEWNDLTPALVANSLIIWLFAKTMRLYNNPNPKTLLFNIGLIIGLSVLLYHPTALLVLVALFAVLVVRPFSIPELVVMFMGVAAPFYFLGAYLFLTDQFIELSRFMPAFWLNLPKVDSLPLFLVSLAIIIVVLLIGVFNWQNKNRRMVIQIRKNWAVLVVMLLVMIPLPFINKGSGIDTILLWAVPVSPFAAHAFLSDRKDTFANIIFWVLVALIAVNNWGLISLIKY